MRSSELILAAVMLLLSGAAFAEHEGMHEIANYINTAFDSESGTFTEDAYEILTGALEKIDEIDADITDDPSHLEIVQKMKSNVFYNLACLEALGNNTEEALQRLESAIDNGFNDREWMESDADLTGLHGDPKFDELLEKIETVQAD